jgi:hypothetical protein
MASKASFGRYKLNDLLTGYGWNDLPITLSVFWLNELAIVSGEP